MNVIRYSIDVIRKLNPLEIPTPTILCLAAILGSICNLIALAKVHTAYNSNAATPPEFLLIIPANTQKQVSLPLPPQASS